MEQIIPHCVYWIRAPHHTDIFTEGYVGEAANFEKRMKEHESEIRRGIHGGRHLMHAVNELGGWDKAVKSIVLFAEKPYCKEFEFKLRPLPKMAWNIAPGGGAAPDCTGNTHTEEACKKISEGKLGDKNPMKRPEVAAKTAATKRAKGQYTGKEMMEYNANYPERMKDPEFAKQISDKRKKANAVMLENQIEKMRDTVLTIRKLRIEGMKLKDLAVMFDMTESAVSNIANRKTYASVD